MNAMEFIANYESMLESFRPYVSGEMNDVITGMLDIDPHDLVSPNAWFQNRSAMRGFLWSHLVNNCKDLNATRTAT